jgi:uncharacterized protein (DUF169 family)
MAMNHMLQTHTDQLLEYLNLDEEPLGIYYSDILPEDAEGPKASDDPAYFSCFIGNIFKARRKKTAAFISAEKFGCAGGAFYTGMHKPYADFIPYYVSTGQPGTWMHGERFMSSPADMRKFLDKVEPLRAPAQYCIAKPLSAFTDEEKPEIVVFFARPEAMSGLFSHIIFSTGDPDAVVSPFGANCTNIVAWPLYYMSHGKPKAVLGGFDPSARKYLKGDELTLAIPMSMYKRILGTLPDSLFHTEAWKAVRKKTERSKQVWEK